MIKLLRYESSLYFTICLVIASFSSKTCVATPPPTPPPLPHEKPDSAYITLVRSQIEWLTKQPGDQKVTIKHHQDFLDALVKANHEPNENQAARDEANAYAKYVRGVSGNDHPLAVQAREYATSAETVNHKLTADNYSSLATAYANTIPAGHYLRQSAQNFASVALRRAQAIVSGVQTVPDLHEAHQKMVTEHQEHIAKETAKGSSKGQSIQPSTPKKPRTQALNLTQKSTTQTNLSPRQLEPIVEKQVSPFTDAAQKAFPDESSSESQQSPPVQSQRTKSHPDHRSRRGSEASLDHWLDAATLYGNQSIGVNSLRRASSFTPARLQDPHGTNGAVLTRQLSGSIPGKRVAQSSANRHPLTDQRQVWMTPQRLASVPIRLETSPPSAERTQLNPAPATLQKTQDAVVKSPAAEVARTSGIKLGTCPTESLAEGSTYDQIKSFLQAPQSNVRTVEDFISCLPASYFQSKNMTLVTESNSPEAADVDSKNPRVILFDRHANITIAYTGKKPGKFDRELRMISTVSKPPSSKFLAVTFPKENGSTIELSEESGDASGETSKCAKCHQGSFLWGEYRSWTGTYGERSDGEFISDKPHAGHNARELKQDKEEKEKLISFIQEQRGHPRYARLITEGIRTKNTNPTDVCPPDGSADLTLRSSFFHGQLIYSKMKRSPHFEKIKYILASSFLGCPLEQEQLQQLNQFLKLSRSTRTVAPPIGLNSGLPERLPKKQDSLMVKYENSQLYLSRENIYGGYDELYFALRVELLAEVLGVNHKEWTTDFLVKFGKKKLFYEEGPLMNLGNHSMGDRVFRAMAEDLKDQADEMMSFEIWQRPRKKDVPGKYNGEHPPTLGQIRNRVGTKFLMDIASTCQALNPRVALELQGLKTMEASKSSEGVSRSPTSLPASSQSCDPGRTSELPIDITQQAPGLVLAAQITSRAALRKVCFSCHANNRSARYIPFDNDELLSSWLETTAPGKDKTGRARLLHSIQNNLMPPNTKGQDRDLFIQYVNNM